MPRWQRSGSGATNWPAIQSPPSARGEQSSRRQQIHSRERIMARKVLGTKDSGPKVDRRKFLTGVAVAGAAGAVAPQAANATVAAGRRRRAPAVGAAADRAARSPPRPATPQAETQPHRRRRRLRFHGRCHQDARHQISAVQLRLELPRHPRVADQLRQQQDAGVPHLHPRGIRDRHRARLLQDRRQAADDALPRHRRPAARLRWRSTTPGATACRSSSWAATISTPRTGRRACRPSIRRRTSTRWCATSPSGTTRRCRCSTSRSRSCAPTRFR